MGRRGPQRGAPQRSGEADGHGGRRQVPAHRSELDSAQGWDGSGEGGRERVLREPKGKERSEGAVEMEKGRTARRVVTVVLRAAVLGVRAGKRRRMARSRSVGEEPGMGRRVWPGSSACGRRRRRRHGASTAWEEKQRRERDGVRAIL